MSSQTSPKAEISMTPLVAANRLRLDPVAQSVELDGKTIELGGRSLALLRTFMERPMQLVSKSELIDIVWDGKAVSDAVLTTAIRELRQAIGDNARRPIWIKTEHGRGYRFIARVSATNMKMPASRSSETLPAELAETTPDRLETPSRTPTGERNTRWQAWGMALSLVIAVVAIVVWQRIEPSPPPPQEQGRSVAVLPFVTLSSSEEADWFAAGLSEELTIALNRVPDLRVSSRRATEVVSDIPSSPEELGRRLGVANILEGTVRVIEDQMRVSVSLIRTEDGSQVWSQSYDRELENILSLQAEIATSVARTLDTALDQTALEQMASAGTDSIAAYEAYIRGQARIAEFSRTGDAMLWAESLTFFDRARSIDPEFARAHARSGMVFRYLNTPSLVFMGPNAVSGEEYRRQYAARMDAAIASARNPMEAMSYRAVRDRELFELDSARDAFEAYFESHPFDIEAGFEYSSTLIMLGRHDDAQDVVRHLADIIPREDARSRSLLIQQALRSRDFELSADIARETLSDHPFYGFALVEAHWAFLRVGDLEQARQVTDRLKASEIGFLAQMGIEMHQLCAEGRPAEALEIANSFVDHPQSYIMAWHAHRAMNNDEAAYERLLELDRPGPPPVRLRSILVGDPSFDPARFPNLANAIIGAGGQLAPPEPPLVRCPPA